MWLRAIATLRCFGPWDSSIFQSIETLIDFKTTKENMSLTGFHGHPGTLYTTAQMRLEKLDLYWRGSHLHTYKKQKFPVKNYAIQYIHSR